MIDEEKLEKLLEDNYGSLYRELQFMPLDEFVSKYKNELIGVPGFLDLYNQSVSAPHGMSEEQIDSYFDKDSDKDLYRRTEQAYQKELKSKEPDIKAYDPEKERRRKLVEEYQHDYWLLPPAGDWLANKIADLAISPATKDAIINQKSTPEIITRGLSDIVAAGLDAYPGGGIVGKGISYLAGPTVRSINRATSDTESDISDYIKDYGTNFVLGEGIRGLAGIKDLGPVQKLLDKIPLNKWYDIVKMFGGSKLRNLPKPKPGEATEDFLARIPMSDRELYIDAAKQAYVETAKETMGAGLTEAERKQLANNAAEQAIMDAGQVETNNMAKDLVGHNFDKKWLEANKGKAMTGGLYGGAVETTEKSLARKLLPKEDNTKERKQKRDAALDYIIKENERMWKAGFRPNAGIELEAWKKWKGIE